MVEPAVDVFVADEVDIDDCDVCEVGLWVEEMPIAEAKARPFALLLGDGSV